jgi:hypothetical protein
MFRSLDYVEIKNEYLNKNILIFMSREPSVRVKITDLQNENKGRQRWGSFSVYKAFDIDQGLDQVGFILQCVERRTTVNVHYKNRTKTLNTTKDILDFTDKRVEYSNDTYYELFPVKSGKSVDGDRFQSGAFLRYDNKGYALVEPNGNDINEPPTSGEIVMTGKSVFISASQQEVDNVLEGEGDAPKLLGFQWKTDKKGPSAGLPYVFKSGAIEKKMDKLFKDRNVTIHKVVVTWTRQDGETTAENQVLMQYDENV